MQMSNILKTNIFVWVCVVLIANHVRRDGMLDSDEFALAMHLMNIKLDGEYPSTLSTVSYVGPDFWSKLYVSLNLHAVCDAR